MVLFVGSVGCAQSFRDTNNMLLGKVESDGTVRNANNMRMGRIFEDGTIRDSNNMRLGTIEKDGDYYFEGNFLGNNHTVNLNIDGTNYGAVVGLQCRLYRSGNIDTSV